jgi:hypothetical protein
VGQKSAHTGRPTFWGEQQITTTRDHLEFTDLPHLGDAAQLPIRYRGLVLYDSAIFQGPWVHQLFCVTKLQAVN